MERQEIEVEIQPNGQVTYHIIGVKGSACDDIAAVLDRLGEVQSSERTAEYYDQEPDVQIAINHE